MPLKMVGDRVSSPVRAPLAQQGTCHLPFLNQKAWREKRPSQGRAAAPLTKLHYAVVTKLAPALPMIFPRCYCWVIPQGAGWEQQALDQSPFNLTATVSPTRHEQGGAEKESNHMQQTQRAWGLLLPHSSNHWYRRTVQG